MRAVLDTNVIISALIQPAGQPARVLAAWRNEAFEPITSPPLLAELTNVLGRRSVALRVRLSPLEYAALVAELVRTAVLVTPSEVVDAIGADPADNRVLEAAIEGRARYVVSGDHHLLDLREYRGVPIVSQARFLAILEGEAR